MWLKRKNKIGRQLPGLVLCLFASVISHSQDKGIVYYTLGNDTTVIQFFDFNNNQYKTTFIQFTGAITKCEATGQLDTNGDLMEVNSMNYRMANDGNWEMVTKAQNRFTGDSTIYIATNPHGVISSRRSFPGQGIIANGMDIASFYTFPYMGFYAPKKNGDTLFHRQLSFNGFRKYMVARLSAGKIKIGSNLMGYLVSTIDDKGRLLKIDGVGSSLNIIANVDRKNTDLSLLDNFAKRRNASGVNVVRTLRDTATIIVAGKKIEIDYWRPHKRGREIFGNVVPWNRVWRTGANNATQLRTNTDLLFDGKLLPAGNYGVWSYLTENNWELIINKNATAWGTDHDPAADLFHVPLKVERLDMPVEIMKISFLNSGEKRIIMVVEWDTYKASVEITIK